jgi:chorismate dehydratase
MLEGPQRGVFDLSFEIPSACAASVLEGRADIGIIPVAALLRKDLAIFRGTGIACRGTVRTILLVSKIPFDAIARLALDSSSRTSVLLSRIVLAEVHGVRPEVISMPPDLGAMLAAADAALVIGDPALLLEPGELRAQGLQVADLGEVWWRMSGLPMVFAVWAGRAEIHSAAYEGVFAASCRYGMEHLDEIVAREHLRRGVSAELARQSLTENLVLELGEPEYRGMRAFLDAAGKLPAPSWAPDQAPQGVTA